MTESLSEIEIYRKSLLRESNTLDSILLSAYLPDTLCERPDKTFY